MSRLDSFIRRITAQRNVLNAVAAEIAGLEGPVLELGLGNGRTFDHLREKLPGRRIIAFDRVAAAYRLSMQLEPGDMQFVNNYHVLHARDAYVDDRAAGKVRHLKRLWLETEVLTDDEKPERFRLGRTDGYWASQGRTKSDLTV